MEFKKGKDTNFGLMAIVAIVAVVGLIGLVMTSFSNNATDFVPASGTGGGITKNTAIARECTQICTDGTSVPDPDIDEISVDDCVSQCIAAKDPSAVIKGGTCDPFLADGCCNIFADADPDCDTVLITADILDTNTGFVIGDMTVTMGGQIFSIGERVACPFIHATNCFARIGPSCEMAVCLTDEILAGCPGEGIGNVACNVGGGGTCPDTCLTPEQEKACFAGGGECKINERTNVNECIGCTGRGGGGQCTDDGTCLQEFCQIGETWTCKKGVGECKIC